MPPRRGILQMWTMGMWQPGSPKDTLTPPQIYALDITLGIQLPCKNMQLLSKWMRQDWLGLCSSPLKPHKLNYLLFLHFRVEASQKHWEEKPRCNWLILCNWSWTRSIWPVTTTTMPLAPGTRRAWGHGMGIHCEPTASKLILKNYSVAGHLLVLKSKFCCSFVYTVLVFWASHHS